MTSIARNGLRVVSVDPADQARREPTPDRDGAPVRPEDRISVLDILRGVALLGILAVNIEDFAGPEAFHDVPIGVVHAAFVGWHANLDVAILTFKWLFIEGKMRALFSMLYGAGCVLLIERIELRAGPETAKRIYYKRNALLLLFGIIHGTLIWAGDILSQYAACGLIFPFLLRKIDGRYLIAISAVILLFTALVTEPRVSDVFNAAAVPGTSNVQFAIARFEEPFDAKRVQAEKISDQAAIIKLNQSAAVDAQSMRAMNWSDRLMGQAAGYFGFLQALLTTGFISEIVGTIILGMGLYKVGFIGGRLPVKLYGYVALAGYAVTVPIVLTGIWQSSRHGFAMPDVTLWMYFPYTLEQIAGALANASLIIFAVKKGWLRGLYVPFSSVGRMAFSNYILTSVICQTLFLWSHFKMYGTLEYYQYVYVMLSVWAILLIISPLWLSYFAFGPLEWVWRSMTYGRTQKWRARDR